MSAIRFILSFISFIAITGCGPIIQPCPDGRPIVIYRKPTTLYQDVVKSFDFSLEGFKTVLENYDAKLGIAETNLKQEVILLRKELDQASIQHQDNLKLLADKQQRDPCDQTIANNLFKYMESVANHTKILDAQKRELQEKIDSGDVKSGAEIITEVKENIKTDEIETPSSDETTLKKVYDTNLVMLSSLFFQSGSSKLTEEAEKQVRLLGGLLKNTKQGRIFLVGSADKRNIRQPLKADISDNYQLSLARAKAVGDMLSSEFGIENFRVVGTSSNYADNDSSSAFNRRVDIYVSYGNELLDFIAKD